MNGLSRLKNNPIIAGLLILIILAIGSIVLRSLQGMLGTPNNSVTPTEQITPTQAEKKNTTSLDINDKTYAIPKNWNLSAVFTGPEGTNYTCLDGSDCHLALITNDAQGAALSKVIVSWPVAVKSNFDDLGTLDSAKLNFLGQDINFTAYKYFVDDTSLSSSQQASLFPAYAQLYGCTTDKICVQADLLESDVNKNTLQQADFKLFLKEFKLQ